MQKYVSNDDPVNIKRHKNNLLSKLRLENKFQKQSLKGKKELIKLITRKVWRALTLNDQK